VASVCVTKETTNFHQNKSNGLSHKNITIVYDASGVVMSDDTIWGITHDHNRTVRFKKCEQLFEYQHLLFLRDIWCSKF